MKRMNVREFRAKISELNDEPIEVVRYSETVGFWIPIDLTDEPKTKPLTLKGSLTTKKPPKMTTGPYISKVRKASDEAMRKAIAEKIELSIKTRKEVI